MPKYSAGLLMYKLENNKIFVFLIHPGGPFFKNKDNGFWSIAKGELENNESKFQAALREFQEETGIKVDEKNTKFFDLGFTRQKNNKIVYAWAFESKNGEKFKHSNFIEIKNFGFQFPEADRGQFFAIEEAQNKIKPEQLIFIKRLIEILNNKKNYANNS